MKKLILVAGILACPLFAQAADVNVDIGNVRVQGPGFTISFGQRDNRGYYWDGYEYRTPSYWRRHDGPRGERHYTGHDGRHGERHDDDQGVPHQGGGHCPPGQAKKGNC